MRQPFGMIEHEGRKAILAEIHARPYLPVDAPRRIYHFAFATDDEDARNDRKAIADICARNRATKPPEDAKKPEDIKVQIRGILAARNLDRRDIFSPEGRQLLPTLKLKDAERFRVRPTATLAAASRRLPWPNRPACFSARARRTAGS